MADEQIPKTERRLIDNGARGAKVERMVKLDAVEHMVMQETPDNLGQKGQSGTVVATGNVIVLPQGGSSTPTTRASADTSKKD